MTATQDGSKGTNLAPPLTASILQRQLDVFERLSKLFFERFPTFACLRVPTACSADVSVYFERLRRTTTSKRTLTRAFDAVSNANRLRVMILLLRLDAVARVRSEGEIVARHVGPSEEEK